MLEELEHQERGYSIVIVTLKLLIAAIASVMIFVNLTANYYYSDLGTLFPDLEGVDFGSYMLCLAVIIVFVQAYGAVLYIIEEMPSFRQAVKPALFGYLIWDSGLFFIMFEASFIQYYCYNTIDSVFQVWFKMRNLYSF